jgi:adenylate cyclase
VVNLTFTLLQSGFLAVSYLTLNFTTVFVDLTAPFAFSLIYFTVARFNSTFAGYRRSGHPFFSTVLDEGRACRAILAQCQVHIAERNARLALGARIKRQAGLTRYGVVTPPLFKGLPLMHGFFRDTIQFYWVVPKAEEAAAVRDVLGLLERTRPLIEHAARRHGRDAEALATWGVHAFDFVVDAQDGWRLQGERGLARLFALASGTTAASAGARMRVVTTEEFDLLVRDASAAG